MSTFTLAASYIKDTYDGYLNAHHEDRVQLSEEAARRLDDAGVLAPDLPEPNDPDIFVTQGKGWLPGGAYGPSVWTAPGSMVMVQRVEPGDLTPEEARALAYAILAAADYAEVVPDGT